MTLERWLRVITGILILISLALAFLYESEKWLYITGIFGFNLFQSGFTNWCPIMAVLRVLGIGKKQGKEK
ncbi:MAG: DUF2892 domain-containing protein [Nitrospirota bacterium]